MFLIEPVANPDSEGAIRLRLRFRFRDLEGDPADAILYWSAEADDFPDIADLALDWDLRRLVLLDPDERAPLRIITP